MVVSITPIKLITCFIFYNDAIEKSTAIFDINKIEIPLSHFKITILISIFICKTINHFIYLFV